MLHRFIGESTPVHRVQWQVYSRVYLTVIYRIPLNIFDRMTKSIRDFFGIFHYIAENWVLFMNSVTVEWQWQREMGKMLKIFAMQKANS